MAGSNDGSKRCSALAEYIKSLDEVERQMYERFKKRTRKKNNNERGQGILAWTKISGEHRKKIL
jgi:hypothetical protein